MKKDGEDAARPDQPQLYETLAMRARQARENAYAPYSGFRVGAALLAASGKIYLGCNVENVSYPAGVCAERSAVCAAVTAGERRFLAIAVAASEGEIVPCGLCRQTLAEFSKDGSLEIVCARKDGYRVFRLRELLPEAFTEFHAEKTE